MPSTLEREPFKTTWVKRWKSIDCLGGLGDGTAAENVAQGLRRKNAQQLKNCCFPTRALRGVGQLPTSSPAFAQTLPWACRRPLD